MNSSIKELLSAVQSGELSVNDAVLQLKTAPFTDIGFAKVDTHRVLRQGVAEVIYGEGKTPEQIVGIIGAMQKHGQSTILITRLCEESATTVEKAYAIDYRTEARIGRLGPLPEPNGIGKIVVATGGTSDIPVAEEAAITAEVLGNEVTRLYDVGVAGLHRLLAHLDDIMNASVIIAIAGMEGALASVIGGLADCPVIAVPTSVGYGASFNGLSALLPIGMKKSRPGTLIRILCRVQDRASIVKTIFKHTTTLGVRENTCSRYVLARDSVIIQTPYGSVRRKDSCGYGVTRSKYEHDDLARIAKEQNIGIAEVVRLIENKQKRI